MFGYGEVNQYNRSSTLMSAYRHLKQEQFMHYVIKDKKEVYLALKAFSAKRQSKPERLLSGLTVERALRADSYCNDDPLQTVRTAGGGFLMWNPIVPQKSIDYYIVSRYTKCIG